MFPLAQFPLTHIYLPFISQMEDCCFEKKNIYIYIYISVDIIVSINTTLDIDVI